MRGKSFIFIDKSNSIKVYKCEGVFRKFRSIPRGCWSDIQSTDKIKEELNQHDIYMIYEGEEFYIKYIKLPKVKHYYVDTIIKNELTYIFKDITTFTYTYEAFRKDRKYIDILVFCINSEKNIVFNSIEQSCRVKGIFLIQLSYFQYIRKIANCTKSIIILEYNNILYFLSVFNDKIVANTIIKNFGGDYEDFIAKFQYIFARTEEMETELRFFKSGLNIYFSNFKYEDIIGAMSNNYVCRNLGNIDFEKLLEVVG
jgi:hypothetical protein